MAAPGPHPDCCQVIDFEGSFQEDSLNRFVQQNGVIDARTNYQVVAIMGPQSSGKSTLMNHVVSWCCIAGAGGPVLPPYLPGCMQEGRSSTVAATATGMRMCVCV